MEKRISLISKDAYDNTVIALANIIASIADCQQEALDDDTVAEDLLVSAENVLDRVIGEQAEIFDSVVFVVE